MSKKGEFRQFHLGFWQSPDVEEMDPIEKLLYAYMITSPKSNMEGVYKTTLRRVSFETGIDRDMIPKLSARMEEKGIGGIFVHDSGTAWVVISSAPEFMPATPQIKQRFRTQLEEWSQELIDYLYKVSYQWPKWDDLDIPMPSESDPMPGVTRPSPDGRRGSPEGHPTLCRHDTDTNTNTILDNTDLVAQPLASPSSAQARIARTQDEISLYEAVKADFLKQQPQERFTNYAKEGKAIKQLIQKAQARSPDRPGEFLDSMIKMFRHLRKSGDKFWRGQPDLPSALNASGIWDRVLNEGYERYQSGLEADDIYEEVPW